MNLLPRLLNDSAAYTPEGRRLLEALGAIEADPLRVEAEGWLRSHRGPQTEATLAVRRALGPRHPKDWLQAARAFRNVR